MKVGMTGTQKGLTPNQAFKLGAWLHANPVLEVHHGDCQGADATFHGIAKQLGFRIVVHPPSNPSKRALCTDMDEMRTPKPYLERNHDIVDDTDVLIALPASAQEELRSGTWATIRYATRVGKPIIIIPGDINGPPQEN